MSLSFSGLILAVSTLVIIGVFHPLVIKVEYHYGTRLWWLFLIAGVGLCVAALFIRSVLWSSLVGVVGAACLWSIRELFQQKRRVERGWFPMNPRRRDAYSSGARL